ncbi:hypothetical protein BABINDRAFT_7660 [Babjeviella inositovora NRRL Y-12698]|uniref:PABS domain-containing protein n=1 Tax=Babjeviella inositovora NRRL Y-12698 TaxID=984486 RepID=A0A1E3QRC7_9ASCO|nr:uncharacterized protein BABINDRAFT_7660 [Babjeviella inositovora NRRL Y-12698]ODQ80188.1 hypothetical protein BABINDRAFT_7660 [Babjeviella inositovora NRRL Y-12698]
MSSQLTHVTIQDGWFREVSEGSFPGQAMRLRVKQILHVEQSPFQDILVFESTDYGNVLVLDGIVQVSERDEFSYQEMISHLPLFAHSNPKRVLVIGGGDGGVLREVVKHDSVEEATLVEIDEGVIHLSKKYLPHMAKGFDHPKVNVVITDGFEFLNKLSQAPTSEKYDVIITDSSDPDGPAEMFFQQRYFKLLHDAIKEDGIIITQASENVWLKIQNLKTLMHDARQIFPVVELSSCTCPTYTSGQLALMICSKKADDDVKVPKRVLSKMKERELFRYYNSRLHEASFILPTFAEKILVDESV